MRGGGLQSIPRGSGEVPSCRCFGGLLGLLISLKIEFESLSKFCSSLSWYLLSEIIVWELEIESMREGSLKPNSKSELSRPYIFITAKMFAELFVSNFFVIIDEEELLQTVEMFVNRLSTIAKCSLRFWIL